jgi:tRNA threonylcarbamoyladenosine biosynthesis protein TsaE
MQTTNGPEETEAAGARLASELRPGDVVLVSGELGAGKTTLIRGAARALGVEGPVTSPTFTIGHRYEGSVLVAHLDLFRLGEGPAAAVATEVPGLLDEYLDPGSIAFVEWPDAAPGLLDLPDSARLVRVEIRHAGEDRREIVVKPQ